MKRFLASIKNRFVRYFTGTGLFKNLMRLCSKSGLLSDFWYLVSGAMRRENQAVLAGRIEHLEQLNLSRLDGAVYTLRRNTHRVEKGLIMKPRRDVFAKKYILETVELFSALAAQYCKEATNKETLQWANDVLVEYFSVVASDPVVDKARKVFESSTTGLEIGKKRPYRRDTDAPPSVSLEQLRELAIRRRSCRWFLQKPVPRELIDAAMEVAGFAPSACNRQPFEFRFFDEPELVKKVAAVPMGTVGFSHNFPCVAVIVGNMSAFPFDRDRHVPYIDGSLAAMGLQFGLETLGISSCCINWPDIKHLEHKIAQLLGLKKYQRVIMMMAIGFPDANEQVPYSQKKPLSEIRSYNRTC